MNEVQSSKLSQQDKDSILTASKDYIESWYSADAERMKACLHPDFVKRVLLYDEKQKSWILGARRSREYLTDATREGGENDLAESEKTHEITILDTNRGIASVKVKSHSFLDYLHLGKFNDRWLLVNALWEFLEQESG